MPHTAMIDLDESLRAIYFAPVPIVVLSSIRSIKLINEAAERMLGLTSARCVGQRLDRFVKDSSKVPLTLALNEATESRAASSTKGGNQQNSTRLELFDPESSSSSFWADLFISAWFFADPHPHEVNRSEASTINAQSSSDRAPHEAHYTITLIPSPMANSPISESQNGNISMATTLKEAAFDCLETAIIALSKDGKTEVRNKAFDKVLSIFPNFTLLAKTVEENDLDVLPAVEETIIVWDGDFERPLTSTEWPIFQCAFLGQSAPSMRLGLESKATGERVHIELFSKAIRDKSGYGGHIGGVCTIRDVSAEREKRKVEAELQGDMHFRHTVDGVPQLVWSASRSGYIEYYNRTYLLYTGCTQAELQGAGWQSIIPDHQLEDIGNCWSDAIRTGTGFEKAMLIRKHTGEYRWFLSRATPTHDLDTGKVIKWFGTCTDIHDQVNALSASHEKQIHLQSVVNHAAVTLWAVDKEGIITVAEGPGVRELDILAAVHIDESDWLASNNTKKTVKESVIGRSIYDIWDVTNIYDSVYKALQGQSVVEEIEVKAKWLRNSFTPLRAHNREFFSLYGISEDKSKESDTSKDSIVGVVIASMDITDRKEAQRRMEESLTEKARALTAEESAREASRLKSEFLANMSHEIRTPIAGIIGLTELLLDEEALAAIQRDYAETIQRSAEGLLAVINDVLDFSKVEVGKLEVEQVPFNLVVLLRDLKRMMTFATHKKGLELRDVLNINYTDDLLGDLGRMRQVIMNLLTNAIKFTSHGHITLEATEVSSDEMNSIIRFDIKDTGCGIHADALARLFQPFSQADASTARRFGGTGLGLSICKNLVELMNGEIGLDSIEGIGSHAWFIIPFKKANSYQIKNRLTNNTLPEVPGTNNLDSNPGTSGTSLIVPSSLNRPRKDIWILIAEDNAVNARIALRNVEKLGFSCTVAKDGNAAIQELSQRLYDLVLMDCQMPDCDGYEATKLIRLSSNEDIRLLPVIALTASAIKGDRERALDAGMVDYLAKPVKRPALETTMCKWLFDHTARQTLSRFLTMDSFQPCSPSSYTRRQSTAPMLNL